MSVLSYSFHSLPLKLSNKGMNFLFPPLRLPNKEREEYSKIIFLHSFPFDSLLPNEALGKPRERGTHIKTRGRAPTVLLFIRWEKLKFSKIFFLLWQIKIPIEQIYIYIYIYILTTIYLIWYFLLDSIFPSLIFGHSKEFGWCHEPMECIYLAAEVAN